MAKKPPRRGSDVPIRTSVSSARGTISGPYSLQSLLKRARELGIRESGLADQRGSFVIGSAALANTGLTRSSIVEINTASQAGVRTALSDKSTLEVENLAKQYDFVISWIKQFISSPIQSFDLRVDLVKEVHRIAFHGLTDDAGKLRSDAIAVSNSAFEGPSPQKIPGLLKELCDYVNHNWTTCSALHLAAYVLWRLLWIHPFPDGNGRTARGIAYLVLSAKLGVILPGTPTLPELISQNRNEYYKALEAADKAARSGRTDVSSVEAFLGGLLALQLQNTAFLPASAKAHLEQVIDSRIMRANSEIRRACYRTTDPKYRLWSQGPYLALHVAPDADIRFASQRQYSYAEPFPGLLSSQEELAAQVIHLDGSGQFIKGTQFDISRKRAFFASPDASFGLIQVSCKGDMVAYDIHGALYCVRLGPRTTIENCHETFEFLISRHIRAET